MLAADVVEDPIARWTALVLGVGGIILGVLYAIVKLRALASDLGIVKHEVKNNHDTNLREEADDRHDENRATLVRIERKVGSILDTLAVHEFRIGRLDDEVENTRDRKPDARTHDQG
jgi:hypothetical protein